MGCVQGGGTLDVALLRLELRTRTFLVLGAAGDPHLGGEDFDRALAKHLEHTVLPPAPGSASCRRVPLSASSRMGASPEAIPGRHAHAGASNAALLQAVERAKRRLSAQDASPLDLPGVCAPAHICSRASRRGAL